MRTFETMKDEPRARCYLAQRALNFCSHNGVRVKSYDFRRENDMVSLECFYEEHCGIELIVELREIEYLAWSKTWGAQCGNENKSSETAAHAWGRSIPNTSGGW